MKDLNKVLDSLKYNPDLPDADYAAICPEQPDGDRLPPSTAIPGDRWTQFFYDICLTHAWMSKDPNTGVGVVIVDGEDTVVSAGYNGFCRGACDTPSRYSSRGHKLQHIIHAEPNAIFNAARCGRATLGCVMYMVSVDKDTGQVWGGAPCLRCAYAVIQAGIAAVISPPMKSGSNWARSVAEGQLALDRSGVQVHHEPYRGLDRKMPWTAE